MKKFILLTLTILICFSLVSCKTTNTASDSDNNTSSDSDNNTLNNNDTTGSIENVEKEYKKHGLNPVSSNLDFSKGWFKTTDMDGNEMDDSIFSKNENTIINIWASWCGPCIDELPLLQKLNDEDNGIGVVALQLEPSVADSSIKTEIEDGKVIFSELNLTLENRLFTPELYLNIGDEFSFVPYSIIVDNDGNVLDYMIYGSVNPSSVDFITNYIKSTRE